MEIDLFENIPEIKIGDYLLTKITQVDKEYIFKSLSNPEIIKFYGVNYKTFEETQIQMDWYDGLIKNKTGIWWKILLNENPIGALGFYFYSPIHQNAEIGYWINPEYQGKGILSFIMPKWLNSLKAIMPLHRIEAIVETENKASSNLLLKCGFKSEGIKKEAEIKNQEYIDLEYFAKIWKEN